MNFGSFFLQELSCLQQLILLFIHIISDLFVFVCVCVCVCVFENLPESI